MFNISYRIEAVAFFTKTLLPVREKFNEVRFRRITATVRKMLKVFSETWKVEFCKRQIRNVAAV